MQFFVAITAVVAMTSVLLVFQMGQPRIWMSMSRDGLLPKQFARVHPKYKTPSFSTIVTGAVVGIPLFFTDEKFILDFTSIGTLFAFVLVCGGVLMLPPKTDTENSKGKFKLPYINSKFITPLIVIVLAGVTEYFSPSFLKNLFNITSENAQSSIPMLLFCILCIVMSIFAFLRNLSLIPLMGLLSCCYLLTGMGLSNWIWFGIWLVIGLIVYLIYGYNKSKLAS